MPAITYKGEDLSIKEYISTSLLDHLYDGIYFVDTDKKILYWNKGAELITGYTEEEMLGKFCQDNLLKHEDSNGNQLCNSTCPLAKAIKYNKNINERVYLYSKEGKKIPVKLHISPIKNLENNIIGAIEVFTDDSDCEKLMITNKKLKELNEKLEILSETDSLTSLQNRRFFNTHANKELLRAERYKHTTAILILDIDHFKKINDTYGHLVGDVVLKKIAKILKSSTRETDIVCRFGGEEFIILLPEITLDNAFETAEKIRKNVEKTSLNVLKKELNITISIGVSLKQPDDKLTLDDFINQSDQALYKAKESGRNRTMVF